MNLLEHYILEVYDVKKIDMEDSNNDGWSFILVDLMSDCYGRMQRSQVSFANMKDWEKTKQQGYYLA